MKLTRKQAFELSIKKWEALAKGKSTPYKIKELGLRADCALCEKYYNTTSALLSNCNKCPIRPKLSSKYYLKIMDVGNLKLYL